MTPEKYTYAEVVNTLSAMGISPTEDKLKHILILFSTYPDEQSLKGLIVRHTNWVEESQNTIKSTCYDKDHSEGQDFHENLMKNGTASLKEIPNKRSLGINHNFDPWCAVPSNKFAIEIASKIPVTCLQELFDNAEKIKDYCKENI